MKSLPRLEQVIVHTEFHRLVTELQDAMQGVFTMEAGDPGYLDAYADLSSRRKELYEWVQRNTPRVPTLYATTLKF